MEPLEFPASYAVECANKCVVQQERQVNIQIMNNMWMALDFKLFTPGRPLPDDTFWVGEQAPDWWHRLHTEYCMLHAPYLMTFA